MFVYRLAVPIDEFDDFVDLPTWLNKSTPEKTAWLLESVLALADTALACWHGDMCQLPSVCESDGELALIVKQTDNGATFVISRKPAPWAEERGALQHETQTRDIVPFTHPTRDTIAQAMANVPQPIGFRAVGTFFDGQPF